MNELEDLLDIAAVHIGHPLTIQLGKGWSFNNKLNGYALLRSGEFYETDYFKSLDELILCLQLFCHLSCLK